jgi:hypothetical protein
LCKELDIVSRRFQSVSGKTRYASLTDQSAAVNFINIFRARFLYESPFLPKDAKFWRQIQKNVCE